MEEMQKNLDDIVGTKIKCKKDKDAQYVIEANAYRNPSMPVEYQFLAKAEGGDWNLLGDWSKGETAILKDYDETYKYKLKVNVRFKGNTEQRFRAIGKFREAKLFPKMPLKYLPETIVTYFKTLDHRFGNGFPVNFHKAGPFFNTGIIPVLQLKMP
jgi:hypothetical protein